MFLRLPSSTLLPYTTLFRSHIGRNSPPPQDRIESASRPAGVEWLPPRAALDDTDGWTSRAALEEAIRRLLVSKRSEEHTSELQSLTNLVCRLLLEKKNAPTS